MICDECEYLIFRNLYKIECEMHDGLLLDVKQCMHFKQKEDE